MGEVLHARDLTARVHMCIFRPVIAHKAVMRTENRLGSRRSGAHGVIPSAFSYGRAHRGASARRSRVVHRFFSPVLPGHQTENCGSGPDKGLWTMLNTIPHPATIPPMPAVARILSRYDRDHLSAFISVAIDLIDILDGDTDLEEMDAEDSFSFSGPAQPYLNDGPGCPFSDEGGQRDEDGVNTLGTPHDGPGCPFGDPGGGNVTDEPHDPDHEDGF